MTGLPDNAMRVTLHGKMSAAQTWSAGLWLRVSAPTMPVDCDAAAAQLLPDAHAWANAVKGYWSTDTTFEGVKCAFYPSGSPTATFTGLVVDSSPVAGVGSTNLMPTYVSACHSIRTARSGRSYRGRFYMPVTSIGLAAQGQLDSSTCGAFATALATLCTAYNVVDLTSAGLTGAKVIVASFTRGTTQDVTAIEVDSLLDTQHRREDKIGAAHFATHAVT